MRVGHEAWVTRDYGGTGNALTLSKARLGDFAYHLLKLGGDITGIYAMNADFERCYCQAAITLPVGKKGELERLTNIPLEKPVVLSPAISRERGPT